MPSQTFQLNVPDLPDSGVWFANAAAWKNYWLNVSTTVNFGIAANAVYVEIAPGPSQYFDLQLDLDGDGTPESYVVPSKAAFDQLVNSYKDLRQAMKDAGLIEEAQ